MTTSSESRKQRSRTAMLVLAVYCPQLVGAAAITGPATFVAGSGVAPYLQIQELSDQPETRRPGGAVALPPESWVAAGERYERLGGRLPVVSDEVRTVTRMLLRGTRHDEERLEVLLRFVRSEVAYLLVPERREPYRPAPPATVLARRWGDCKDKTFLLIAALTSAGIEAHPLLVTMAPNVVVDPSRPTLAPFDHVLVAARLGGRLYYLEPSQSRGGLHWLHPALQGRHALLVDGAASRLVRTPSSAEGERREIEVSLEVGHDGSTRGAAVLRLQGGAAVPFLDALAAPASGRPEASDLRPALRDLLSNGLQLVPRRWKEGGAGLPELEIEGEARAGGLLVTLRSRKSLSLPPLFELPVARAMRPVEAVSLPLGTTRTVWRLKLQDGCHAAGESIEAENEIGSFRYDVSSAGQEVTVESRLELDRPRVGSGKESAVSELLSAVGSTRRLEVRCPGSSRPEATRLVSRRSSADDVSGSFAGRVGSSLRNP